ncbi:MAG: HAMP domain-containing histidine kinase [Alphaproteobacteria bacterium]|nr:HAMP domain-containing histidine kinase [Alphaproteobacteria bacterium]
MSTHAISQAEDPRPHAMRHLKDRLELVIDGLRGTVWFNPTGVGFVAAAFWIAQGSFGRLSLGHVVAAIVIQCATAGAAGVMRARYPTLMGADLRKVQWQLTILQAFIGLGWAAAAWLLWCDGNSANNMFVGMVIMCIAWAMAFLRSPCRQIFFTGLAALMLPSALLFATSRGPVAFMLCVMVPIWLLYILLLGLGARRRVQELFDAQEAKEKLGEALRLANEESRRKQREAEAANASKTNFLANMSHELRTPLNAILGFSDIIASQSMGPDSPRYRDYAGDIHASGTHLLALINDILDVAKIESGKMEIDPRPLDTAAALAGIERIMAIRAREKQQQLSFTVEPDAPWPVADQRAFRQIALNLISNAVKFTPRGGLIRVACRRDVSGGFILAVEDNGPGIPQDKLESVFSAFSQVENRYDRSEGGTGLGLALVRGLAELHGGRAWIESESGKGARCYVYFPLAIFPAGNEERAAS